MRARLFLSIAILVVAARDGAAQLQGPKLNDYTKVDLKSLGIEPCPVEKDEKTGFLVGGKNATALIPKLPSVAGRSIKNLE